MTGRGRPVNPRPGVAVCVCTARGRIVLYDPEAYMRRLRGAYGQARRRERGETENDLDQNNREPHHGDSSGERL